MKRVIGAAAGAALLFSAATGFAAAGAPPETTDAFICPVLGGEGGANAYASGHGPFVEIAGGDLTLIGPDVSVPLHATNDDGAGSPGGDHASPGDSDYSPIWAQ